MASLSARGARGGSLRTRLIGVVLLLSVVPLTTVGVLLYRESGNALEANLHAHVASVAALKRQQIEAWAAERRKDVTRQASLPLFQRLVARLRKPGTAGTASAAELRRLLEAIRASGEFSDVFLLEPLEGRVMLSTATAEEERSERGQLFFREARMGAYVQPVQASPAGGRTVTAFAAPVRAASGELLAILVARADVGVLDPLMTEQSGLGETGRTVLVDPSGHVVSPALPGTDRGRTAVVSETFRNALAGSTRHYSNHEGREVTGAREPVPALGLVLFAEMGEDEAFAPVRRLRYVLAMAITVVSGLAIAAGIALTLDVTRAVGRLVSAAGAIGRGDLTCRAGAGGPRELVALGTALDRMADDLRRSRLELEATNHAVEATNHTLEAHVEERTAALRESEARFRLLFEDSPLAMWVYDTTTLQFLEVNGVASEIYGYSRDELLRMRITEIRPPEDVSRLLRHVRRHAREGTRGNRGEWRHRLKSGGVIDVEVFSHPLVFHGRRAALVAVHDITERKQIEQQLRQAQKMEAVGRVAGGVAHDFNNLMTVILSRSELLLARVGGDARAQRDAELIRKTGRRAADLTRQLLAFSRKQVLQPKVLAVGTVVTGMLDLLRRVVREDIELVNDLAPDASAVRADRAQLEQVLLNLVVNARDAMPRGGALTIRTADVDVDETMARLHPGARPGPHVLLEVRDTGHGMDEETLSHIFEPFFTTKGPDHGTGLGLATVYGIVKQHGGVIWAESRPGAGSTFRILLPGVDQEAEEAEVGWLAPVIGRGAETLLVVEDEPEVGEIVREILESHGYTVLEATTAGEALAICARHPGPIDLLIADVIMPELDGPHLARRLGETRPDMKTLYISAHDEDTLGTRGLLDGTVDLLSKPFTPEALLERVRQALGPAEAPVPSA
ncbi:MAG: PAS domain S-box protein [Candidatus Rokubacteria bacterium]|nr:PAS domain S-box protein [Candidatus Rokubacteria bacterium]